MSKADVCHWAINEAVRATTSVNQRRICPPHHQDVTSNDEWQSQLMTNLFRLAAIVKMFEMTKAQ